MNPRVEFEVFSNPIPKQSFKVSSIRNFTPTRITDWQNMVGRHAQICLMQMNGDRLAGDLRVSLYFWRKDKRKVDLDNLSKCVLDAMNGIIYEDDKQIMELHLYKAYDKEKPRLKVIVEPIQDASIQEKSK